VPAGTSIDPGPAVAAAARPLRLTIIGPTPPLRGGIAHYTTALVRALRARHHVQVVGLRRQYPKLLFPGTSERDASGMAIDFAADVLVDPLAPWTWPAAARAIAAYAPDLIMLAWWQPALGAVLATFTRLVRRRRDVRVAFLCHNVSAHEGTAVDRALASYAFRHADSAIVHSEEDARGLRSHYGLQVVRTVHPAYDIPEFGVALAPTVARARLGLSGDTLLFFGLVRPYKGLGDLLHAMPAILRNRRCTLVVAGEFYASRASYDQLIRELAIGNAVRLVDRYIANEDVSVYFSAADVVVAPYRAATQSGVVALAQQFHRPVIVSRAGGLPDMIVEGVTGLSVPAGDPDALATAVLRIYEEGVAAWHARVREARRTTWGEEIDAIERIAAS
jgi:glycosyltransferase involved in cell wall biosynthesis